MRGDLHPSLRVFIDCFKSPSFPKVFPRGGGVWDQDPILVRDFRLIQKTELQCKEDEQRLEEARSKLSGESSTGGGAGGLDDALEQYIQEQEGETGGYF